MFDERDVESLTEIVLAAGLSAPGPDGLAAHRM
jgi:hypothetical protein